MAHRSRVGVVLFDYPEPDYDAALVFWAAATGVGPDPDAVDATAEDPYVGLGMFGPTTFEVQRTGTGTAARIHVDVESDDVPAEVARLLELGAAMIEERSGYSVLRDPGGLLFCVVPVQSGADFDARAREWPG